MERDGHRSGFPDIPYHSRCLTVSYALARSRGEPQLLACARWERVWLWAHMEIFTVPRGTWVFPAQRMDEWARVALAVPVSAAICSGRSAARVRVSRGESQLCRQPVRVGSA